METHAETPDPYMLHRVVRFTGKQLGDSDRQCRRHGVLNGSTQHTLNSPGVLGIACTLKKGFSESDYKRCGLGERRTTIKPHGVGDLVLLTRHCLPLVSFSFGGGGEAWPDKTPPTRVHTTTCQMHKQAPCGICRHPGLGGNRQAQSPVALDSGSPCSTVSAGHPWAGTETGFSGASMSPLSCVTDD